MSYWAAFRVAAVPIGLLIIFFPLFWYVSGRISTDLESEARQATQNQAEVLAAVFANDDRFLAAAGESLSAVFQSAATSQSINLDGRIDDWPENIVEREYGIEFVQFAGEPYAIDSLNYRLSLANDDESLYLFYRVTDDMVTYRAPMHISVHRNDHVQIALIDREGTLRQFTISAAQPGQVLASEVSGTGRALRQAEGITGFWRPTDEGYALELRLERSLFNDRIATVVADIDDPDQRALRYMIGPVPLQPGDALGRISFSPSDLQKLLSQLPYGAEIRDSAGEVIATNRNERVLVSSGNEVELLGAEIRRIGATLGHVYLEVPLAVFHEQALQRIVLAFFGIFLTMLSGTLVAAKMIQRRMLKVGAEAQQLVRLGQHNEYLEKMASRLNHEVRTPVSVIKSSIEHLQSMDSSEDTQVYVERAAEGVRRLNSVLNKMSEARKLEELLVSDDVMRFELADLVTSCVAGYEIAFPGKKFVLDKCDDEIPVTGIPDIFAQMLDKLIDNAVGFSTSSSIIVRLTIEDQNAVLRILNEGPELPGTGENIFDSMVTTRSSSNEIHLGLGLYLAKVIADFHGAELTLANREDTRGVIARVVVPILRITANLR